MSEQTRAKEQGLHSTPPRHSASASHQPHTTALGLQQDTLQRALADPKTLSPADVMQLQRTIGNRAVCQLLGRDRAGSSGADPTVQRAAGAEGGAVSSQLEADIRHAQGGGRPLPDTVRESMETQMGISYGNVRVHTDAQADRLSRSLNAEAFTLGTDTYFRKGAYNPSSHSGKQLLTHEMTHVAQQSTSDAGRVQTKLRVGPAKDIYEAEADRVAAQLTSTPAAAARLSPPKVAPVTVQRKLKWTRQDFSEPSNKAKFNGMMGKTSKLTLLLESLDRYHRAHSPEDELKELQNMRVLATQWLDKHGYDQKDTSPIFQLRADIINKEIPAVEKLIPKTEEHDEYMKMIDEKKLSYITQSGVGITKNMKDWYLGKTHQMKPDRTMNSDETKEFEKKEQNRAKNANKTINQYKLTQAEATAIGIFTADDYQYINPAWLNNKKLMEDNLKTLKFADETLNENIKKHGPTTFTQGAMSEGLIHNKFALSGLRKLPDWKGVTLRGEAWSKQEIDEFYPLNGVYTAPKLASSSVNEDTAWSLMLNAIKPGRQEGVILNIMLKTGKEVQPLSDKPTEGEVTIMPGTRFKVTNRKYVEYDNANRKRAHHQIYLVEM